MECNHILGWVEDCDERVFLDKHNIHTLLYLKELFNLYKYCPDCGTKLGKEVKKEVGRCFMCGKYHGVGECKLSKTKEL